MHITTLWNGTCRETGEHLSEHLEGELHGLRRLRIHRHLVRCELCQTVLRSLARTLAALRSLGTIEPAPTPSVVPAVVATIREER